MGYYICILFSASLDLYYIGSSADPLNRLKKHLGNHKGFTSKAKDWVICHTEFFDNKTKALAREKQFEKLEKPEPDSTIDNLIVN